MDSPPLAPDADTARYWLKEELSQSIYGESESLLSKLLRGLMDFLDGLSFEGAPSWTSLVLIFIITAVIALAIFYGGTLRRTARAKKSAILFEDAVTTAGQYWQRADASAQQNNFSQAILFSYRAIVRSAEERVVISEQPGRTAVEAANAIGAAVAEFSGDLAAAAHLFDEVIYGDREATAADYETMFGLGQRLEQHKTAVLAAAGGEQS